MKVLFVYNPHAGHMQIKQNLWDIINIFSSTYKDLHIYASQSSKDIYYYVKKNASKYDLLIVSGGDGSLSEAVNGVMKLDKKPKLGYIPAGSTNDYATSLKLPKEMNKCASLIVKSKEARKLDVGKFNNNYFVYIAAFGAFTEVAYSTPQDIKNVLGHLAYVLNGINSLSKIKSYKLKIENDNETFEGKYIYGMITNSLSVGGVYQFNKKDVLLNDGLFEVMLIKQPNDLLELSEITASLLDSRIKSTFVQTFKTKSLTIESNKEIPWTLDGEYGGSPSKIKITNINKVLTIIK